MNDKEKQTEMLGSFIKKLRVALRLSLKDVSLAYDIPASKWSRIELGDKTVGLIRGDEEVEVICHYCGCPMRCNPILNVPFPNYVCDRCYFE